MANEWVKALGMLYDYKPNKNTIKKILMMYVVS